MDTFCIHNARKMRTNFSLVYISPCTFIYIFIHQYGSAQKENTNIQTKSSIKNTLTTHNVHSQSSTIFTFKCPIKITRQSSHRCAELPGNTLANTVATPPRRPPLPPRPA